VKQGKLKVIGVIHLDGVRSQIAYCTRRIKSDIIHHELGISTILQALAKVAEMDIARGLDVDQRFLADAEVLINGRHLMIEFDTGSMRYAQLREDRWERYRTLEVGKEVLWVTVTEDRRAGVMTIDHPAKARMTFATLAEITNDPWRFAGGAS
jgi:hypothetical protein